MEIFFENPGHREGLVGLGVLDKGQISIKSTDLIKRVLETGKVEPAIYILRQELATYHQTLMFLDLAIEIAQKDVEKIKDQESFEKAGERVGRLMDIWRNGTEQAPVLVNCVDSILEKSPKTKVVEEHLEVIKELDYGMREIIEEKGDEYLHEIETLEEKLNQLRG